MSLTARAVNDRLRRAGLLAKYTGQRLYRSTWDTGYRAELVGGAIEVTLYWYGERKPLMEISRREFACIGLDLDITTRVVMRAKGAEP